ncbi:MAG: molecular chaperone HtpG [Rickettsiella sp.]|nr:molecular chaperone HtpG [Rickettsiella sp.]
MTVAEKKTLGFQTEVNQLLQLMIHSLYSNKEIFIRELISNASDAVDKLRFKALEEPALYAGDAELNLKIEIDKTKRLLILTDNGIGMSEEEIIANLGTIAKSGTKEFLASLTGDKAKDTQLIGQFGVGFYSAFMVSEKITVNTRAAGLPADKAICWESTGDGQYTIESINKPTRGTEIILHLQQGEDEFLETWRLRSIILKYSDHITLPIMMKKELSTTESDAKTTVKLEETESWETVNKATALWTLPKNQIKDDEYKAFYKHVAHDFQDPIIWSHNKVEGKQEYTILLYIPSQAPFDLWNHEKPRGLKLYVNRVFIMDDAEQFLPRYLRFVKGVVDSNDLPLNISREILQNNKAVDNIRNAVTKRILELLSKLAKEQPDQYKQFWISFGSVLKEGLAEDFNNREAIAKLLRFCTTNSNIADQTVSLEEYVARMKPIQDKIYYITADNYAAANNSPHLEIFRQKEIEVLLLYDRIDEWLVAHLTEFNGKSLQSVAKDADITEITNEKSEETQKKNEDEFKSLLIQMKEILGNQVKEVRISQRLTSSPACIINEQNALSAQMQRILQATGQSVPPSKPILEVNPEHRLVKRLKDEQDDTRLAEWTHLLLEESILAEGGHLEDPAAFVKRLNSLLED